MVLALKVHIAIIADTLLTEHGTALPPQGGTIKSCCLPGDICVSFCNSADSAQLEFKRFAGRYPGGTGFADVVSFFEHSSEQTGNDYIVAFSENPRLVKITDGKRVANVSKTVWIGDQAAYTKFREYEARRRLLANQGRAVNAVLFADELERSPASDLYYTMRNLVAARTVPTVGGFVSVISNRENGFRFSVYSDMFFDWPKWKNESYAIDMNEKIDFHATEENAGYSVAQISPGYVGVNLVAFYLVKGKKLFFFYGDKNELPNRCQVFPDISSGDIYNVLNRIAGCDLKWLVMVTSAPNTGATTGQVAREGGSRFSFFVHANTFPKR
jgi:hypothetical protein